MFLALLARRFPQVPAQLTLALALGRVQAAALLVAGVVVAVDLVVGSPQDAGAAGTQLVLALGVGALLLWLIRALFRGRLWARTPVVFLEILFLPFAYTLLRSGYPVPGVLYALVSLAVLVLLFTPPARGYLEDPEP